MVCACEGAKSTSFCSRPASTPGAQGSTSNKLYADPEIYRFRWHQAIVNELVRLRDVCKDPRTREGYGAFSVSGLAGNIRGANE